MIRNLKAFGLAAVAVLAMSALAAATAQATSEGQFTASSYPVHLSGADRPETLNAFTTSFGEVECEVSSYTGEASEASSTVTITPSYSNCGTKTVTMNECDYIFHTTKHIGTGHWSGAVSIDCPPNKQIEVHAYTSATHVTTACTFTIPEQGPLSGVTFTENSGKLIAEGTVEGIDYQIHGGCDLFGTTPTFTNGVYHLNVEIEGTNGNSLSISTNE